MAIEQTSNVQTLQWQDDALVLLDQRLLPHKIEYVRCTSARQVSNAIASMVVRGAPAIGIAAAFGVALAAGSAFDNYGDAWREHVGIDIELLRASRPTAVNLAWAIESMIEASSSVGADPRTALLRHAREMQEADVAANKLMGDLGATFLAANSQIITHCNAGALATAGYGTALGVVRSAWAQKNLSRVFATETRPWLQGARLTAWELQQDSIPVTLIADGAAAQLMNRNDISWVITGADRVAANGDVANKIGTYALALCARAHGVRMMVAAPLSTIDLDTLNGAEIPIEERAADELVTYQSTRIAPVGVTAMNPVFDVTPASLIDVLVTEKGALEKPDRASIAALFET